MMVNIGVRSSRAAKFIAALLACTAHGAVAVALMQSEPSALIEGAAGAPEAAIGSSFADMAEGSLSAEPPDTPTEAEPVQQPDPTPAEPTPAEDPQAALPAEAPERAPAPAQPVPSQAPPAEAVPMETTETLTLSAESDVVAAIAPEETAPLESEPAPTPPAPAEPEPEPQTAEAPTPPDTSIAPEREDVSAEAVAVSRRPMTRPETLDVPEPRRETAQPRPEPQRRAEPTPQRQQQGNAQRNARAGQASGTQSARAASSGAGGQSAESGNAAASNYPGQVMRKLSRVPRPRLNARGSAVIAFRISGGGGLAGLSVARSSGSAALDQAALRVVQRASPFPAPPSGARRSFSIEIKAR